MDITIATNALYAKMTKQSSTSSNTQLTAELDGNTVLSLNYNQQ